MIEYIFTFCVEYAECPCVFIETIQTIARSVLVLWRRRVQLRLDDRQLATHTTANVRLRIINQSMSCSFVHYHHYHHRPFLLFSDASSIWDVVSVRNRRRSSFVLPFCRSQQSRIGFIACVSPGNVDRTNRTPLIQCYPFRSFFDFGNKFPFPSKVTTIGAYGHGTHARRDRARSVFSFSFFFFLYLYLFLCRTRFVKCNIFFCFPHGTLLPFSVFLRSYARHKARITIACGERRSTTNRSPITISVRMRGIAIEFCCLNYFATETLFDKSRDRQLQFRYRTSKKSVESNGQRWHQTDRQQHRQRWSSSAAFVKVSLVVLSFCLTLALSRTSMCRLSASRVSTSGTSACFRFRLNKAFFVFSYHQLKYFKRVSEERKSRYGCVRFVSRWRSTWLTPSFA